MSMLSGVSAPEAGSGVVLRFLKGGSGGTSRAGDFTDVIVEVVAVEVDEMSRSTVSCC